MEAQSSSAGDAQEGCRPRRIAIDHKLYEAAVKGDVKLLEEFLQSQVSDFHQLDGVTVGDNTVLHIAATSSCDPTHFVEAVCNINRSLLTARNKLKETPLHIAAKAGNYKMVEKLIQVLQQQYGLWRCLYSREEILLRATNMHGETALHEAVQVGHEIMVEKLINTESSLTGIVDAHGFSPLYLATMTNALNIVKIFTSKDLSMVSCAGPNGKTALHAAVLEDNGITEALLRWNKSLATMVDDLGSTPLHYAASVGNLDAVKLLLEHESSAAYMADKDGLFPIHIAAKCGRELIIQELIEQLPDLDELLDKEGRNFLHLVIVSGKGNIIGSIPPNDTFLRMLNTRDKNGNTPLHLASESGDLHLVQFLISFRKVCSSIINNNGFTPVDLAMKTAEQGFTFKLNKQYNLLRLLMCAGALPSPCRLDLVQDYLDLPKYDRAIEIQKAKSVTRNLAIISVLISTVTFTASLTMPGGYRADADQHRGTPILYQKYLFKAFTVANTVAFLVSIFATAWLIYAGNSHVEFTLRMKCLAFSVLLVKFAAKAMICAFGLAISTVLYQVNRTLCILISFASLVVILINNLSIAVCLQVILPLQRRLGWRGLLGKSVNPLTSKRIDVGIGQVFSFMFFKINQRVGQKFWVLFLYSLLVNCVLYAIIFLIPLV